MVNFTKIDEACVVADDGLYHFHKNESGYWDVWCASVVVAYNLTLTQAKQVVRAIKVVKYHNVVMSKAL